MNLALTETTKTGFFAMRPIYIYLFVYLLFQLCAICHEPFEQFWDEELEEWHLRDAIRVNDQTYHPICYEDHTDVSRHTIRTLPLV